nr:hypothetical protein [Tanacetum cinerariifolium]
MSQSVGLYKFACKLDLVLSLLVQGSLDDPVNEHKEVQTRMAIAYTQDLPAPRPAKPARKPQSTAQKAPPKPSISSPVTTTQPAPTSVPAKTQENKCKQTTGTTDKPAKAKRIKRSVSRKTRQSKSSPKSVGESEAEEVPAEEPQIADEDANFQKAMEESMKDAYALPKGPLPPVVIREPESGKFQPLPEVPGKGKAKVSEEQVAHDLLSLQKHKKTSPTDQYRFQRRVSKPTASSFHDVSPYEILGQLVSEDESEKIVLGVEKGGQDEGQAGPDPNAQTEGQTGSDTGAQAKGQARSNPDETSEGQVGSNPDETSEVQAGPVPGNVEARVQSTSSSVVHAGSDREHMDIDVANVSLQPSTEQLYEGFTATVYPNVQENLKLAIKEPVLLEEPASSSGTLSSLQHLSRDFTFGDQFFSDKPSDADKSAKTEVESMVNVPIQQAMSSIPLMTSPIIDLTSRPESRKEHPQLKATTTDATTTTTTTLPPPQAPQQSMTEAMMVSIAVSEVVTDAVDLAMQTPLRNWFRDLPEADIKEILHQRMWETDSYKSHEVHMQLFKALEKLINRDQYEELTHDLAEARKKMKKGRESPKMPLGSPSHQPPLPPPPAGTSGTSGAPRASGSQVTPHPPPPTSTNQDNLDMDEAMGPDEQAQLLDEEDIRSAHIPTTGDITTFMDWICKRRGIIELKPQDLKGPAYEIVKRGQPYTKAQRQQTTTTGGPPGQVTIQSDLFFNKDLEYLRYGSKGRRPALSVSKIKAAYYPDAGPEQMVPDQFWIEEECKYNIAAMYGISHWWFQRQRFYIDRHTSKGDRSTVRTHMRILSVVRIEVFSITRDFKYMYPSDYEDLNLLNLQGHLNHLPPKDKKILTTAVNQWTRQLVIRQRVEDFQLGIESYQTHVNLTKPQWTATGFEYKHDYTVIESPRAVIFWDRYGVQMMMRFNEIHKFNDGTLQQIVEELDYRVKEFRISRMNPGLNTRFWTRKDVDRCNAFMFAIQRRLRTLRIFCNLESFVGGRVREGDYRLLKRTD